MIRSRRRWPALPRARAVALALALLVAAMWVGFGWLTAADKAPAAVPGERWLGRRPDADADARRETDDDGGREHPIRRLMREAAGAFDAVQRRQSQTLAQAVAEYRRRYGMAPPPHFDAWWAFCRRHRVRLPDEFDGLHHMLRPFWGLRPATVRARARDALAAPAILALRVRDHRVLPDSGLLSASAAAASTSSLPAYAWQRNATVAMMAPALPFLPDLDLAFNLLDEPRVMVPHDDLVRLLAAADRAQARAAATRPRNHFTSSSTSSSSSSTTTTITPEPGAERAPASTRFSSLAHQPIWAIARASCPPSSPARALDADADVDDEKEDSDRLFVHNETAHTDVCAGRARGRHGFFEGPNAFSVAQDLVPVFSQSKPSSFADVLYPSPWYWQDRVAYDPAADLAWPDKAAVLYWRGSTNGGYSAAGAWRRSLRQRFVRVLNSAGAATVLVAGPDPHNHTVWRVDAAAARGRFRHLVDVGFTHVGQCSPGDCAAQRALLAQRSAAPPAAAWAARLLADLDGNAFSGRFYAFLRSRSAVLKLAVFREWHADWLRPWVHYAPLSLSGRDWLEAARFFLTPDGDPDARALAAHGRDWAAAALRNVDLEAWLFRLMLEYARLVDDRRDEIGFSL